MAKALFSCYYSSVLDAVQIHLCIEASHKGVRRLVFVETVPEGGCTDMACVPTVFSPFIVGAIGWLEAYFSGARLPDFPALDMAVTETHFRLLRAISDVKEGTQATYGAIAEAHKTSPRAVGRACSQNPVLLYFPCHRIVGKNPRAPMQYQAGSAIKKALWAHEKSVSRDVENRS